MPKPDLNFRLNEKQRKLAEDNYYLIHWFMGKRPAPIGTDPDDYLSVLTKYYLRSIATYNPSRAKISTYVFRILVWGRAAFFRKYFQSPDSKFLSIHSAEFDDDMIQIPVHDDQDSGMELERKKTLANRLIKTLGPVREQVIRMHISGLTMTQISKRIGVSRQRVKQVYDKSIRIMQAEARSRELTIESGVSDA